MQSEKFSNRERKMRRAFSQPLLKKHRSEIDLDKGRKPSTKNRVTKSNQEHKVKDDLDVVSQRIHLTTSHQRQPKRGEKPSWEKHGGGGGWRQEQRTSVARLEKQLKARWALEDKIQVQLNRFHAHFKRATVGPIRLKDITQLLIPKWAPSHELAALSWLGDWRPSAILDLIRSLARSSPSLSDMDSANMGLVLSQLIHEIRIEEAVIDEEMTEIQTNCILHLSFGGPKKNGPTGPVLTSVLSEFNKIHRVIKKAQNLRVRVLEMVVKKVLGQTDAAEFLVSFAAIQDAIHQFAAQYSMKKGPISVPVKLVDCDMEKAESAVMRWEPIIGYGESSSRP